MVVPSFWLGHSVIPGAMYYKPVCCSYMKRSTSLIVSLSILWKIALNPLLSQYLHTYS